MFTASNLILSSMVVASGLVGLWFVPVAMVAGAVGDYLSRDSRDE